MAEGGEDLDKVAEGDLIDWWEAENVDGARVRLPSESSGGSGMADTLGDLEEEGDDDSILRAPPARTPRTPPNLRRPPPVIQVTPPQQQPPQQQPQQEGDERGDEQGRPDGYDHDEAIRNADRIAAQAQEEEESAHTPQDKTPEGQQGGARPKGATQSQDNPKKSNLKSARPRIEELKEDYVVQRRACQDLIKDIKNLQPELVSKGYLVEEANKLRAAIVVFDEVRLTLISMIQGTREKASFKYDSRVKHLDKFWRVAKELELAAREKDQDRGRRQSTPKTYGEEIDQGRRDALKQAQNLRTTRESPDLSGLLDDHEGEVEMPTFARNSQRGRSSYRRPNERRPGWNFYYREREQDRRPSEEYDQSTSGDRPGDYVRPPRRESDPTNRGSTRPRSQAPTISRRERSPFSDSEIEEDVTNRTLTLIGPAPYNNKGVPKLELKKFRGQRQEYAEFKTKFMTMVGRKQIFEEEKAVHLLENLEGPALEEVKGLAQDLNPDTYTMMWKILESNYGGERRQRSNQTSLLAEFKPIKDLSINELRRLNVLIIRFNHYCEKHSPEVIEKPYSTEVALIKNLVQQEHLHIYNRWLKHEKKRDNLLNFAKWIFFEKKMAQKSEEDSVRIQRGSKEGVKPWYGRNTTNFTEERSEDEEDVGNTVAFQGGPRQRAIKFEASTRTRKLNCEFCKEDHGLYGCATFRKEGFDKRNDFVMKNKICYHCLEQGHNAKQCTLFPDRRCNVEGCTRYHHRILHPPSGSSFYTIEECFEDDEPSKPEATLMTQETVDTNCATYGPRTFVGIRMIPVWVTNGKRKRLVVACLDSCSDNTCISTELAQDLKLEIVKGNVTRKVAFLEREVTLHSNLVKFDIEPFERSEKFPLQAWTVDNLVQNTQVVDWIEVAERFEHLKDLPIPPLPGRNSRCDILLGCEYAHLMAARELAMGQNTEPIAERTALGWACSGPIPGCMVNTKFTSHTNVTLKLAAQSARFYNEYVETKTLEKLVERHWRVEAMGLEEASPLLSQKMMKTCSKPDPSTWSEKDRRVDDKMNVIYLEKEKAYQASIPWKGETAGIETNYEQMIRRQRIRNDPAKLVKSGTSIEQFKEIFDGYLKKGYIEKISNETIREKDCWWLNYFPVVDTTRETTKCRIVFDAKAENPKGQSLNTQIDCGPNRLNDLFHILLKFRMHEFALSADISEMFLRVRLDPKDRRFHRFWFNEECYQWCVILFGNNSSPNISQKVLEQNNLDHGRDFPVATETIAHYTYMDDAIRSMTSEQDLRELARQLPPLLSAADMKICKFYTNSKKVARAIPKELCAKQVQFVDEDVTFENNKILGLTWDANSDQLQFVSKFKTLSEWSTKKGMIQVDNWTKRLILRASASIYDPLGLISPFAVQARVLLQQIWGQKDLYSWDTPLSKEIEDKWLSWLSGVFNLQTLRIPRHLGILVGCSIQLHVFVDASHDAYAAACYLRVEKEDQITTRLICSKARVTPLKAETISRLELMGAVIGTRLAATVVRAMQIDEDQVFYWTDSETCLYWLRTPAKFFKAYVANRCGEIQTRSSFEQWRHVPGKENPADIPTRKISVEELIESKLWWEGPEFLRKGPEFWPEMKSFEKKPESLVEEEYRVSTFISQETPEDYLERLHPKNYSAGVKGNGYVKCLRALAWVMKACNKFKGLKKPGCVYNALLTEKSLVPEVSECAYSSSLTRDELKLAENFLVRQSQKESFPEEIKMLQESQKLSREKLGRHSELLKFFPTLDEKGVVRSRSRLRRLRLPYDTKYPVILDRRSELARLYVECLHHGVCHALGHNALKAKVNEKFFVLGLGTLCLKIKHGCLICKKTRANNVTQQMSDLPKIRFSGSLRAFENVGLDFAGPFELKVGQRRPRKKVSVLVLTCLATRAVHFEVTDSQDTSSVLNALSRFCSLRGVPRVLISDNQTSFHSADRELDDWVRSIDMQMLQDKTSFGYRESEGIQWIYNPPLSPHFGGIFETMVKAMKRALKAIAGEAALYEDDFRTVIAEAASLLNSRPLSKIGNEEDDLPLTPNHFLVGQMGGSLAPPNVEADESPRERWRKTQLMISHVWKRFLKEIPPLLATRKIWHEEKDNLKVDSVVLEIDPNLPQGQWKKLRVLELIPSEDGLVRKVKVISSDQRVYERNITRLCPIV